MMNIISNQAMKLAAGLLSWTLAAKGVISIVNKCIIVIVSDFPLTGLFHL